MRITFIEVMGALLLLASIIGLVYVVPMVFLAVQP